ncbi:hypothetical protein, partial [Escherichia coli]|uniref:hypothetical protein n=1 Tax=Escherichia coli TaxID=562 RepID=UPI001F4490AC
GVSMDARCDKFTARKMMMLIFRDKRKAPEGAYFNMQMRSSNRHNHLRNTWLNQPIRHAYTLL